MFGLRIRSINQLTIATMTTTASKTEVRSLSVIAREIRKDWKNVYFGAKPYLDAMSELITINDYYFNDTAKSIVIYFLSNASTWRGEVAKRVKSELKQMAGIK